MSQRMWDDLSQGYGNRGILGVYFETVLERPEQPLTASPSGLPPGADQSAFEYAPLLADPDSFLIRLLELLPGSGRDGYLACRLTHHRLADCQGRYEALSYVWGNTSDPVPLSVNGKLFPIGQNLYQALSDLQQPNDTRTLWVDALCIDQTNIPERNQQVADMAQIYQGAARTVIYLCPAYKSKTPAAFAMVEKFATEALSIKTGLDDIITLSSLSQGPSVQSTMSREDVNALEISVIGHLAESPWWQRAWTAQEVLLTSNAIIMAGSYSMEWGRFCMGVNFGLRSGIIDIVIAGMLFEELVLPYLSTQALHNEVHRPSFADESPAVASAQRLFALLVHSRGRHASDPRDKIYANLGLNTMKSSITNLGIEPDYDADAAEVYRNATKAMMLNSGSLDVLGACLPDVLSDLPTWVPDWNNAGPAPRPLMYDTFGGRRSSHASSSSPRTTAFTVDGKALVLSGHHVTSVQTLSPVLPRPYLDLDNFRDKLPTTLGYSLPARILRFLISLPILLVLFWDLYYFLLGAVRQVSIFAELERFGRDTPLSNPVPGEVTVEDDPLYIYWRTISAGAGGVEGASEASRLFHAWRAENRPLFRMCDWNLHRWLPSLVLITHLRTTWSHYNDFMRYLEMLYWRRLGKCANGFLALLPAEAQRGDKIVLVDQGRVPLVLRREKEGESYSLVGEAYVEGIMEGEAFKLEECEELRIN